MEAVMDDIQLCSYPKYKASEFDWLGMLPEHWSLVKFKYLFKEINERSNSGSEDLLSVSQYTGVTLKKDNIEDGSLLTNAETLEGYKKVNKGDLVSNIMLAWNGSLGFSPFEGITSPAYAVYRLVGNNNQSYFHYLLRTDVYKAEFKRNSSGVIDSRLRLYTDDFYKIYSILPPVEEQAAIANFLDHKTALIDKAIAQKERLIELLKERRRILIHKAITRGLNTKVKMKDSGVECIGEIPEHWKIVDVRRFVNEHRQGFYSEGGYSSSGHRVVRITDMVDENKIDLADSPYYSISDEEKLRFELRKGDFLFQRTGSHKKICVFDSDELSIYASYLIRFRFSSRVNPKYLLSFFNSAAYEVQLNAQIHGGVNPNIHAENIKGCKLLFPPLGEQEEISKYVQEINKQTTTLIHMKVKEISSLTEYKSILINAAVTGKIKVP